jgi:hypothetical protein
MRGGFQCFIRVARAMGFDVPEEADPAAGTAISYPDFLAAVARLREVDFPIERDPEQAWPDFVGWRVNYEHAAYALTLAIDAPPAPWSGPRRHLTPTIDPARPAPGRELRRGSKQRDRA